MAGYSYPSRGSSGYSSPRTDDWGKTSYASDHVCRPVIIDAEGRKRPIVSFNPSQNSEYYVVKTETVVTEHVSPFASEHKQTPYWSPNGQEIIEESWHKHPRPVHDRPPKVDEFITKVQNEASTPRFGPLSASTWHQTTKPTGYDSQFDDHSNTAWQKPHDNGWVKPSSTAWSTQPNSGTHSRPTSDISTPSGYHKKPSNPSHTSGPRHRYVDPVLIDTSESREDTPMEPKMISSGGWVRPSPEAWASPPNSNLSKPTSDIPMAMGILMEATKPQVDTAPNYRYTEPGYKETIDSNEAAKRYGNFKSSKPYATENNYTATIDSKEAARKYRRETV